MPQKKQFYSTTEVASICNVHRNTIILAIKKGDLRASSTPGGHNRVAHKDLVKFIRERDLPVIAIPGDEEAAEHRPRVLVVDDDPTIVKLIEKGLGGEGYEVISATNGYDAGRKTAKFSPELILLDYMLPDIDGVQVYRSLRESEDTASIRFVVITSFDDIEKLKGEFGEQVPVLAKPFTIEDLRRKINTVMAEN